MSAKKYQVGKLARKHLLAAIEFLFESDENCIVFRRPKYEIRATRKPHGLELKWAKPGTFFEPR